MTSLPKGPRELWATVRPELRNALKDVLSRGETWSIGGGTILAARWNHRVSDDIDLKITPVAGESRLAEQRLGHFNNRMTALGATEIHHGPNQVVVEFGNSRLDIYEGSPGLKGSERVEAVEGELEVVLSSAQILHGKIRGRGLESPTRDLYDIGVAGKLDREALETTVNALPHHGIELASGKWEALQAYHRHAAKTRLKGVPAEFEEIADDPASHAAEAAMNSRYRQASITWERNQIVIEALCEDGETSRHAAEVLPHQRMEDIFQSTGIGGYLRWNAVSPVSGIIARAEETRNAGRDEPQAIWSSRPGPMPKRPSGEDRTKDSRRTRRQGADHTDDSGTSRSTR